MRFKSLIVAILLLAQVAVAAKTNCARALIRRGHGTDLSLDTYKAGALLEGEHGVSAHWLLALEAIVKTPANEFKRLVPKETFPEAQKGPKEIYFSTMEKGIRIFDSHKSSGVGYFKPIFYHSTTPELARSVLSDRLRIGQGAHNMAAVCLGDAHFRGYQGLKNSIFDVTLLLISIDKDAKILDLTKTYGHRPGEYSYYGTYQWYDTVFLPELIKGNFRAKFPHLTAAAKTLRSEARNVLGSKEAFGLLMGADMIMVSEIYGGGLFVDEYWVINPTAIDRIHFDRGRDPRRD